MLPLPRFGGEGWGEGAKKQGVVVKERARSLRRDQTDAERVLWQHLRNRRLLGCKFRRQHPIGPFFVDFVCLELMLVIEIDGGQHALDIERDAERTAYLGSKGFSVLRFWNNQVLSETESVLEKIYQVLRGHSPSP
jgi:adenine-specific DNA-methyltransferase